MSLTRPLRGACHCGRNRYVIAMPASATETAQVRFNTEPLHQISFATPLAAFVRVPLSWLNSSTHPLFPDESHAMIRRVYTHPEHQCAKRHFCGFCGTALSYWSEDPLSEAEYISLTLGSLLRDDLSDLDELGLIPERADLDTWREGAGTRYPAASWETQAASTHAVAMPSLLPRKVISVPWFDALVEGTRLGSMRQSYGISTASSDGRVQAEWEIIEWTTDAAESDEAPPPEAGPQKRKKVEVEGPNTSTLPDRLDETIV